MTQTIGTCERCGVQASLITVENIRNPKQMQRLCQVCKETVIRPNTVWQVKKA